MRAPGRYDLTDGPVPPAGAWHLGSSLRTRSAEATWALAADLMPAFGIRRVTDITRLDQLGLPVFASVRPRGQALCVHAGKGLGAAEARVGALMEALEFAVAEPQRTVWQGRSQRVGTLCDRWGGAFTLADLAPRRGIPAGPDRLLHTVPCDDISGGHPAWLPAELVFLPYGDPHGPALFGWSSNGLASGNTLAEATLHGLLEVLERDALALNTPCDTSRWLPTEELPPPFGELAAHWQGLGVALAVRLVPNDFGLPCFRALLAQDSQAHSVDLAAGSGLHLDAGIALARAVCEAAQSRLSTIHGGRDDLTRFFDRLAAQGTARDARSMLAWREAFDHSDSVRWQEVPDLPVAGLDVGTLLDQLLRHLAALGFPTVLRHRFDLPLNGLHVVKVIVPRCEETDVPLERVGPRLLAQVRRHA
jgi:ribosomal protein S12 methylthiotransferase accessory factor